MEFLITGDGDLLVIEGPVELALIVTPAQVLYLTGFDNHRRMSGSSSIDGGGPSATP